MGDSDYLISKMENKVIIPIAGIDLSSKEEMDKIYAKVEIKVKDIINKLKASHSKFLDNDFGSSEADEHGGLSLYGDAKPQPAGSKYPEPDSLKWERPQYADNRFDEGGKTTEENEEEEEEEEENEFEDEFGDEFGSFTDNASDKIWCKHGKLFLDGTSSGDVLQGNLGDCWFLSALAVLGAQENLLETCFWRYDDFKEHGVFVCRFFKDCNMIFVIIDDRLPVKVKDGKLIFAGNKDPNELWVPLIEKAYAKLHGCYKALIGGFSHNGLADMTGYCPRLIVLRKGYLGYSEEYQPQEIWDMLCKYKERKSLMGCSIQSNPKEKAKVEGDAGNGLIMSHAYSLLNLGEITIDGGTKVRLIKVRNPWGRGEWEGPYGDRSDEREKYDKEIDLVFNKGEREQEKVEQDFNDGTFFMTFEDWLKHYTSIFVALNFPNTWTGKRCQGHWTEEQGGNRSMGTWVSNPRIKIRLEKGKEEKEGEFREVFIGLYIQDTRMTMGGDYYKDPLYANPVAFDLVTEQELELPCEQRNPDKITNAARHISSNGKGEGDVAQPPYNFGSTQIEAYLQVGKDYYIVPSLYKQRKQPGTFYLNIYADVKNLFLDGDMKVSNAQKPMVIGGSKGEPPVQLKMSVAQYYSKKELLRERIVSEAKRLNLSINQLEQLFSDGQEKLSRGSFKRRMMEAGFMLTDFPDDDLVVLDADNDGTIAPQEFLDFYKEGLAFVETDDVDPPLDPPEDDLLNKEVNLEGELTVTVTGGRNLREATTWFNAAEVAEGKAELTKSKAATDVGPEEKDSAEASGVMKRTYVRYDPHAAEKLRIAFQKERASREAALKEKPKGNLSGGNVGFGEQKKRDGNVTPRTTAAPVEPFSPLYSQDDENLRSFTSANVKAHNLRSTQDLATGTRTARNPDAFTAITGMSTTQREMVQKAGSDAAAKLHSDSTLQKAEISRTRSLSALRNHRRNKQQAAADQERSMDLGRVAGKKEEEGVLRKKTSLKKKTKKRDITKDLETMKFLNYTPPPVPKSQETKVREPLNFSKTINLTSTEGKGKDQMSSTPAKSLALLSKATAMNSSAPNRYKDVTNDLWDYLIDCVVTIAVSRPKNRTTEQHRSMLALHSRRQVTADNFLIFSAPKTPLSAPSKKKTPSKHSVGHAATPKTLRRVSGVASVTTAKASAKQRSLILDAKERLMKLEAEQNASYQEIYRRLILVPTTSAAELEGERLVDSQIGLNQTLTSGSDTFLRSLFKKFDKNLNGFISKEEFKAAMEELNVEVSREDCAIFFNRFNSKSPGNIDWQDFISFFNQHIVGSTNSLAAGSTQERKAKSLVELISSLHDVLSTVVQTMETHQISTFENFLNLVKHPKEAKKLAREASSLQLGKSEGDSSRKSFTLPDNCIFQNLSASHAKVNSGNMAKLGVELSELEMARISRVFCFKVSLLMEFIRLPTPVDLHEALDITDAALSKSMEQRAGLGPSDGTNSVAKLWTGIAPNLNSVIPFNTVANYFGTVLRESEMMKAESKPTPEDKSTKGITPIGTPGRLTPKIEDLNDPTYQSQSTQKSASSSVRIAGINGEVLCRIVTDVLIDSNWNRLPTAPPTTTGKGKAATTTAPNTTSSDQSSKDMVSNLSFSGFDAYVREGRINLIERKLKYLMQLEANYSSAAVHMLVHVYLSRAQDEMIVLAHDPLAGSVYKYTIKEDLRSLPVNDALLRLFPKAKEWEETANRIGGKFGRSLFNQDSLQFYNPWDTPGEDKAISDFLSRLRVVRSRNYSNLTLICAEDPKLMETLKGLLRAASSLPFFALLNDLTLNFEVDEDALQGKTIRSFVFGGIRAHKPLYNFLTGVSSSLQVVLSSYNGGIRETFKWKEMLSHLTNYRNPFFTIQLLPATVEVDQFTYRPVENSSAFSGDDLDESNAVKKGPVEPDGAPHPSWDTSLKFKYVPSRLTACRVLRTEIAKMFVDESLKYIIVMAREGQRPKASGAGKEPFWFLTVYDPRSATDYQCGVQAGCDLHALLYSQRPAEESEFETFMGAVEDAAEQNKLLLGPAITPRLEINVYNHNGRSEELLGNCQVSISSILSGSGVSDMQWVKLSHRIEKPSADPRNPTILETYAGEVQLELGFRRQLEIDAEIESELNRKQHKHVPKSGVAAEVRDSKGGSAQEGKASNGNKKEKLKEAKAVAEELEMTNETLLLEKRKLEEKLDNAMKLAEQKNQEVSSVRKEKDQSLKSTEEQLKQLEQERARVERMKREAEEARRRAEEEGAAAVDLALKKKHESLLKEHLKLKQEMEEFKMVTVGGDESVQAPASDHLTEVLEKAQAEIMRLQKENEKLSKAQTLDKVPTGTEVDPALVEEHRKLMEDHMKLLEEAEALRAGSIGVPSGSTNADVVKRSSSEKIVEEMLKLFVTRHEKRRNPGSSGGPLDGLHRLLNSYADSDTRVSAQDFISALDDLMVEVNLDQTMKIFREVDPKGKSAVPVPSLINYLLKHLDSFQASRKKTQSAKTRPVSASPVPPGPTTDKQLRSKSSQNLKRGPTSTQPETPTAQALSTAGSIDWSSEPLPPRWERRFHAPSNRDVYINHDTKKTQWHHPMDHSKHHRSNKRKHENEDNSREAFNATAPAKVSAVLPTVGSSLDVDDELQTPSGKRDFNKTDGNLNMSSNLPLETPKEEKKKNDGSNEEGAKVEGKGSEADSQDLLKEMQSLIDKKGK